MFYVKIAPAVKLPVLNDKLTYSIKPDQLPQICIRRAVKVKVRNRAIIGIITELTKRPPINIGKLSTIDKILPIIIPENVINLAQKIRNYAWQSLGICLESILPPIIVKLPTVEKNLTTTNTLNIKTFSIYYSFYERIKKYEELSKKAIFAGRSGLIIFSHEEQLNYFRKNSSLAIEKWLNEGSKVARWRQWATLVNSKSPKIVVGLRSAVTAPVNNLGLIIIDDPNGRGHKSDQAPYLTSLKIAQMRQQIENCHLVIGDSISAIDKSNNAIGNYPKSIQLLPQDSTDFRALQSSSEAWLKKIEKDKRLFVLINKIGHGFRQCQTCKEIVRCQVCESILIESNGQALCNNCHTQTKMPLRCLVCHGTTLTIRGIGTEQIAERLNKIFNESITILDRINTMNERYHRIIVGTEFAIPYLIQNPPDYSLILGADFARERAAFNSEERLLRLIVNIANLSNITAIETKNQFDEWWQSLKRGDFKRLVTQDLSDRKKYNYPPFVDLFSFKGAVDSLKKIAAALPQDWKVLGPTATNLTITQEFQILVKIPKHSMRTKIFFQLEKSKLLKNVKLDSDPLI